MENLARRDHRRLSAAWRIVWTLLTLTIVQLFVCGVSALPVVGLWSFLLSITPSNATVRLLAVSAAIVPCYMLFALCLMFVSPLAVRLLRWHTPPADAVPIDDLGWPLMQWVRYAASIHIPRVVAGTLFRGTPIWTLHLRLNGARLGRQVYINTLSVSDYNLLEFGDHVVIGGAVQLSGHTVEQGVLKTATVRIGHHVTVGLGSIIEIGVNVGSNCQIGALSFVPKYTILPGGAVYAGIPVRRIE